MYVTLFESVALDSATAQQEVSETIVVPVGHTAAQLDGVMYEIAGSATPQVQLELQQTNDRGEWDSIAGSSLSMGRVGYIKGVQVLGLTAAIIRVRLTLTGADASAILSAGVNLGPP